MTKHIVQYGFDISLENVNPWLCNDLKDNLLIPQTLPYGKMDISRGNTSENARPVTDPQLFISPPSTRTPPHIDGGGLVDSQHLCLAGHNEVVILRSLSGQDLNIALNIITPNADIVNDPHDTNINTSIFVWPTVDVFDRLCKAGFHPTRLIINPGEMLYIGKGCIHMFRKMSTKMLPTNDCHYDLRKQKLIELGDNKSKVDSTVCVSIAWDACYVFDKCGEKEVQHTLEYLAKVSESEIFQKIRKNKGMLVYPKTSTHMFCNLLINECNSPSISEFEQKSKLSILRTILPIVVKNLSKEITFFDQLLGKVKSVSPLTESANILGDTLPICDECNGEIFNVFVTNNNNKTSVCPDCEIKLNKRRSKWRVGFKYYDYDELKSTMNDMNKMMESIVKGKKDES